MCQFTNHADIEAGDERSGIPRPPATASLGEDGLAILLQGDAGSTGWTYEFVPGTPDEQLQEHGREVDAFLGQTVVDSSGVGFFGLGVDDAGGLESC